MDMVFIVPQSSLYDNAYGDCSACVLGVLGLPACAQNGKRSLMCLLRHALASCHGRSHEYIRKHISCGMIAQAKSEGVCWRADGTPFCADIVAMAWLYGNDQLDLSELG